MNAPAAVTYQDWKLVLLSPWGTTGLILALVGVAAALGLTAYSYRHQARHAVRLLLVGLRALSLTALLALVMQPAIQLQSVTRVPNHVALLLDLSRSMAVRDGAGGPTRIQRAAAVLARSAARLERWRRERPVDPFSFGAALKPLPRQGDGGALRAGEPETLIQNALEDLKQQYRGKDIAGAVLLSDGIDNGRLGTGPLPPAARRFLEGLQFPVHTVWVGEPTIRDLAVAEVHADAFAFVRNVVKVEADLVVHGLDDVGVVPVTLETGGAAVAQRELRLQPGTTRYRVQFEFVPPRVGSTVYTVAAPVYAGEALADNNRRSFLLKVIRDRIRVLQVCGRPSWDERFLRQLLKRDPNVDLISFFILRTPADLALVPPSELSLIPFPTEELFEKELGSFDLVLLQNFNYRPYGIGVYLPHLRRYVEDGGGLAMLGGDLSFSSGEYHGTPLAEVLPVRLLPDLADRARLISEEDFRLKPTAEGQEHPILQVGPSRWETQQILAALPALSGVNLVAGATPGAAVLAAHPTLRDSEGKPLPVLATTEAGKGRTLALTTDTSWHWAFLSVGVGGTRQAYDRFWRNAIRWLIQDPELRYLRVIPQADTVRLGTPLRAVIRAYNPDYTPAKGLRVSYEIAPLAAGGGGGAKGVARELRTSGLGEAQLEFKPPAIGAYRIRASADLAGRKTAEEALVLVEPAGQEERDVRATPALLKQLSAATGGLYLGRVAALPDLPFRPPRVLHVNWRKDVELWSRWWFFLGCLFFLGTEWALRRRFGYL